MSTQKQNGQQGQQEVGTRLAWFSPEEIIKDEDINVRPYSTVHEIEADGKEIEELAASIQAEGQQEPVKVRMDEQGRPHIIFGNRRVHAIFNLNADRGAKGQEPIKVMAIVQAGGEWDDATAYRQAAIENLHRQDMSPMDVAEVVRTVRANMGWEGGKNTKKVAEYLKVSAATVTQHEKLLTLPVDKQQAVHEGLLSAQAAFEVQEIAAQHGQEAADEVLDEARKRQAKEEQEKGEVEAVAEVSAGNGDVEGAVEKVRKGGGRKAKQGKTEGAVKARHIRAAARDKSLSMKSRNKADIVAWWTEVHEDQEANGFRNGVVDMFVRTLLMWMEGKVKDETMRKHFMLVTEGVDRGKEMKAQRSERAAGGSAKPKK